MNNKRTINILLFIVLILGLSSCSVTKCRYSNGFKIDLSRNRNEILSEKKARIAVKNQEKTFSNDTEIVKPINLIEISFNNKKQQRAKEPIEIGKKNTYLSSQVNNETMRNEKEEKKVSLNLSTTKTNNKNARMKTTDKGDFWLTDFGYTLMCVLEFLLGAVILGLLILIYTLVISLPLPIQILIAILFGALILQLAFGEIASKGIDTMNKMSK